MFVNQLTLIMLLKLFMQYNKCSLLYVVYMYASIILLTE